jgi:hypothetical protein
MSNWHVSHVPRGSPAHSRRNFPGCCGSSASDTVWSSKSQSKESCGLERQMKKKALSRNKKPGFHTWNRGNTKITKVRPTPVGTSPGVVGALPVIPFGALNRNPRNPAPGEANEEKSTFEKQKNWIPYVKPWKHKNYKSDVATVLFHNLSFRRGIFDRTVHVYRALIGRAPICKIWKKSYELGGNFLTRGMPSYKHDV